MTLDEIEKRDPRVRQLVAYSKGIKAKRGQAFCANRIWVLDLKPRLSNLVGWDRATGPEELQSGEAYNTVFHAVYDHLPACRKCGCM